VPAAPLGIQNAAPAPGASTPAPADQELSATDLSKFLETFSKLLKELLSKLQSKDNAPGPTLGEPSSPSSTMPPGLPPSSTTPPGLPPSSTTLPSLPPSSTTPPSLPPSSTTPPSLPPSSTTPPSPTLGCGTPDSVEPRPCGTDGPVVPRACGTPPPPKPHHCGTHGPVGRPVLSNTPAVTGGTSQPSKMNNGDMDRWDGQIAAAAKATGVPANYIKATMWAESRGNPNAPTLNPDGRTTDYGLMQISDRTYGDVMANHQEAPRNLKAANVTDNILMGAWELKDKLGKSNNDPRVASTKYVGTGNAEHDNRYANNVMLFWTQLNEGKPVSDI
jgi:hypothetical protein